MARTRSARRTLVVNGILTIVAVVLLAMAFRDERTQRELAQLLRRRPNLSLFALAFAIYLGAVMVTFYRWYRLVRALDLPFKLRDAVSLGFIGNVYNLVIPGAVGGDVIKATFLLRQQSRRTLAIASMVIDRILGLVGLFLLAGIAGAVAWPSASGEVRRVIILSWILLGSGLSVIAVAFTPALYQPLHRMVAGRRRLDALLSELVTMASCYRSRIGLVFCLLLLSSAVHALFVVAFFLVSKALFPDEAPSLGAHYLAVPLTLFSMAVPLPFGALGVSENVSKGLFRLVSFPGGALSMIGFRVLMYAGGAVSLGFYLANLGLVKALERSSDAEAGEAKSQAPRTVETSFAASEV